MSDFVVIGINDAHTAFELLNPLEMKPMFDLG